MERAAKMAQHRPQHRPLWIFGYGSLIWAPEFPVAERQIAALAGWQRSFCMRSLHHRGTEENPGLVLALDAHPDAQCAGVAFRVQAGAEEESLARLRARELVSAAYLERRLDLTLADGRGLRDVVAFVIDPAPPQYCGGLDLETQAQIIAGATGGRGPNAEYLFNTHAHLCELGLEDAELAWLARRVREIIAQ